MDPYMAELSMKFFELAGKQSYDMVSSKMKVAKEKTKEEEQQNAYEEIINDLMRDNRELERIAAEYKRNYESLTISDDDIEHLQKTLSSVTGLLADIMPAEDYKKKQEQEDSLNTLVALLNKDTLKTAQLLGFNYKEAIGEPLTEVVSYKLKDFFNANKNRQNTASKNARNQKKK